MNQKPHDLPIILLILSFSTLALCTIIHSVCGQKREGLWRKGVRDSQRRTRQKNRVPVNLINRVPVNLINHLIFKHNFMQPPLLRSRLFRWFVTNSPAAWRRSLACIRSRLYYRRFTHRQGVYLSLSVSSTHHWRSS